MRSLEATRALHVGGVVARGFDQTGHYLLVVSHSGRGVFDTRTCRRVARDDELHYPQDGHAAGIGPLAHQTILVIAINDADGTVTLPHPDGNITLRYAEGIIEISDN
ncbi:MAG: hypothetical protein AAF561_03380 [Planctomycetota bacterium]